MQFTSAAIWLFTAIAVPAAFSQEPKSKSSPERDVLIGQVQGIPSDLASFYLLLRAPTVEKASDREQLLEDAFRYASFAPPVSFRHAGSARLWAALEESSLARPRTDELSLKLRAVAAMIAVNRTRAEEMLNAIQFSSLPTGTCSIGLVANINPSYSELKTLIRAIYASDPTNNVSRYELLIRVIYGTSSSSQLPGILDLVDDDAIPDVDEVSLISAISFVLHRIEDGDPMFTAAMIVNGLPQKLSALATMLSKRGLPVADFLNAYRAYVIANNKHRCNDYIRLQRQTASVPVLNFQSAFNALIKELSAGGAFGPNDVRPLDDLAVSVIGVDETPAASKFLGSNDAAALTREVIGREERAQNNKRLDDDDDRFEASQLITKLEEYARKRMGNTDSPRLKVLETGHLFSRLLDTLISPELEARATTAYVRALSQLWRQETEDLCYAYLRRLLVGCNPIELKRDLSISRPVRWEATMAGLRGANSQVVQVAELIHMWEAPVSTCSEP